MKKIIISILTIVMLGIGINFGYLEKNLYCQVIGNNIKVTLETNNSYKCDEYNKILDKSIKKTYNDFLLIQGYISSKQNAGYWKPIRDNKLQKLNQLYYLKKSVNEGIKTFENNLFKKTQDYMTKYLSSYKKQLETALPKLEYQTGVNLQNYISIIKKQIKTIEAISTSTGFEFMMPNISNYLYFKKQLEGK